MNIFICVLFCRGQIFLLNQSQYSKTNQLSKSNFVFLFRMFSLHFESTRVSSSSTLKKDLKKKKIIFLKAGGNRLVLFASWGKIETRVDSKFGHDQARGLTWRLRFPINLDEQSSSDIGIFP